MSSFGDSVVARVTEGLFDVHRDHGCEKERQFPRCSRLTLHTNDSRRLTSERTDDAPEATFELPIGGHGRQRVDEAMDGRVLRFVQ
jgi:hypothetical protein